MARFLAERGLILTFSSIKWFEVKCRVNLQFVTVANNSGLS